MGLYPADLDPYACSASKLRKSLESVTETSVSWKGKLTCLKQDLSDTPLCEANSEQDMVAVFTPGGEGSLPVTEGIDIRCGLRVKVREACVSSPL